MPFNTFSLPDVYNAAAQYQGQQARNTLMDQQVQSNNALAQREAMFNPLMHEYLQGNTGVQNQMLAADPARAQKVIEFQNQQNTLAQQKDKENAAKVVRYSQFVLNSKAPKQLLVTAFPDYVKNLTDHGVDVNSMTDEQAKNLAQGLVEHFAPVAGMSPKDVSPTDKNLVEVFDPTSPTQTKYVPRSEAAGLPGKPAGGLSVSTNPDGTVTINQGRQDIAKPTKNKIDDALLNSQEGLDRLNNIASNFDPKFLEIGTKFGNAWTAGTEKLGFKPSPEDKQQLAKFSEFKRDALDNISQVIKNLTGAAMSIQEAKRIRGTVPDAGDGIWDGDSPTQFEAKMRATIRSLNQVKARMVYARTNGLDFSKIPLGSIESIMSARADELRQQGMDDQQVEAAIKKEFGL